MKTPRIEYKQKALDHVRSVCPELMKLTEGCEFEWCNEKMEQVVYKVAKIFGTEDVLTETQGFSMYAYTKTVGEDNDPYPKWHSFDNPYDYEEDNATFFDYATIIGHTPHLEHWLRGVESVMQDDWHIQCVTLWGNNGGQEPSWHIQIDTENGGLSCQTYNLTKDGENQSEEFYKAYCNIVGV